MKTECLWLVYLWYHLLNFTFSHLTVWTVLPVLYACGTTPIRLFWTLWNSYLNQATKNVYRYLYFPKFPIPKEIPWWKISKQKRNPLIILVTSTLPSQLQPPPWAGPRVKHYCLRCSFWLLVVVRHFSPFLCLSWFLSVWKYPSALCKCIAKCCIKPV